MRTVCGFPLIQLLAKFANDLYCAICVYVRAVFAVVARCGGDRAACHIIMEIEVFADGVLVVVFGSPVVSEESVEAAAGRNDVVGEIAEVPCTKKGL